MDQSSRRNQNIIIAIIACFFLAGIPVAMAEDGTTTTSPVGGTVTVLSYPQGAAVSLNGEYRGVAPLKLEHVPPGNYLVGVSLAGYNNETIPIILYDGSTREIGVNLELASSIPSVPAGSGSIAVDSDPGGASVTLDGNPVGKTPTGQAALILNSVSAGSHTITVELAGYAPNTSTIKVIKNQVVRVNADFEARSPTIPGTFETQSPTIPGGTPIPTSNRQEPVPLSPLTAVAAAGLIGLAAVFRRS